MISSPVFATPNNTIDLNHEMNHDAIKTFLASIVAAESKVGFLSGVHAQNDKGDLFTNRPVVLSVFRAINDLRISNPSRTSGLKIYLLSSKPRKNIDEGVLSRSGFSPDLVTWSPSMVERVEGSVTVHRGGIVWADMNFDFSNFQGHVLSRPLSHYVGADVIADRFAHLPREMFERTKYNREFVIQCLAKPAKCLEFPADISDPSARVQFLKNCRSVGFDVELGDSGIEHRLYDRKTLSDETLVRWTNELILQRMFESTDSKDFKKYGNALNFHKKYFEDIGGEFSIAHGAPFRLGEIDPPRPIGLNALVQALAYLLSMDEDPDFAAFCAELASLEVQICENAGHFRKDAAGEAFIADDTKFGGGFGCQVGPDQPSYTKHGAPVVPYHAMGHGYSIACGCLFGAAFLGDRGVLRCFLGGAATRGEAIANLMVAIFSKSA